MTATRSWFSVRSPGRLQLQQQLPQLGKFQRLGQHLLDPAGVKQLARKVVAPARGQHDGAGKPAAPQLGGQLQPVATGHAHVGDDKIDIVL